MSDTPTGPIEPAKSADSAEVPETPQSPAPMPDPTFVATKTLWINPKRKVTVLVISGVAALVLLGVGAVGGSLATHEHDGHVSRFDDNGPTGEGFGRHTTEGKTFGPGQDGQLGNHHFGSAPQGPQNKQIPGAPQAPSEKPTPAPSPSS